MDLELREFLVVASVILSSVMYAYCMLKIIRTVKIMVLSRQYSNPKRPTRFSYISRKEEPPKTLEELFKRYWFRIATEMTFLCLLGSGVYVDFINSLLR